jgi:hypothetical protein
MREILAEALRLRGGGLSLLPVRRDGSKAPDGKLLPLDADDPTHTTWKPYQERLANNKELEYWFDRHKAGLAIIAGHVSGHVEILDFDDA